MSEILYLKEEIDSLCRKAGLSPRSVQHITLDSDMNVTFFLCLAQNEGVDMIVRSWTYKREE